MAEAFKLGLGLDVEVVGPRPRFGQAANALLCPGTRPGPLESSWALCPWISVVTASWALPVGECPSGSGPMA